MESTIQGVEDSLINSLIYKLGHSSNYILNRRSICLYPSGGNAYSPVGVRVIKFTIAGQDWLDPSTLRVSFRLRNKHTTLPLKLLNYNPASFFRRLIIRCGGQTVEDIDYYNRVSNMMQKLLPTDRRYNDMNESFPLVNYDIGEDVIPINYNTLNKCPILAADTEITLMMPLLSGLLNSGKLLNIRHMQSLQIELECVINYIEACCQTQPDEVCEWEISEARIICDVVQLDSQLENEFTQMLLDGKTIPISYSSFVHQVSNVGTTDSPSVVIARAFTRLERIYVTLYRNVYEYDEDAAVAGHDYTFGWTTKPALALPLRESTFFYHPQFLYNGSKSDEPNKGGDELDRPIACTHLNALLGYYDYNPYCQVSMQIQLGSQLYPEREITNSQESWYYLRKSIGCQEMGSTYNLSIPSREYRSHSFIQSISFEKAPGTFASGQSTRSGDLLMIKLKNVRHFDSTGAKLNDNGSNQTLAEFIHCTLQYSAVMNISDTGIAIFD